MTKFVVENVVGAYTNPYVWIKIFINESVNENAISMYRTECEKRNFTYQQNRNDECAVFLVLDYFYDCIYVSSQSFAS